jgi:thiol-disulfide isomerase/thioredoxin
VNPRAYNRSMRGTTYLSFFLLLFCNSLFAQNSKVRISSLLLTQEDRGWRVDFPDGAPSEYSLRTSDLLTEFDGNNAGRMGPLAVTRAFNDAYSRVVQLTIRRGSSLQKINLWRDDGPAPATKPPEKSFVSTAQEAPDFTLPTLNDVHITLASQRGKWVLISFWATWCVPCREEAEVLNKLAKAYPQQLTVLALAVKDSRENISEFVARVKPSYTILDAGPLDAQPALSYGVGTSTGGGSVPVNVLVRPDGGIAYVQGGYVASSPLEKQVRGAITAK